MIPLGPAHEPPAFTSPPRRVVSLVPSLTESMFDLGFGDRLVGVTDFCRPPAEAEARLCRLGGTRSPDVRQLIALQPDLVIANQEENSRQAVEEILGAGLEVWVTFPCDVNQAMQVLWQMVQLFPSREGAEKVKTLERGLAWASQVARSSPPVRLFCPIWQDEMEGAGVWWMTFNRQTYAHDLLARLGAENAFAHRDRRYPLAADLGVTGDIEQPHGRDTRYPRVTVEEVRRCAPELILLPSEPFAFSQDHVETIAGLLADTPAVQEGRVVPVDGTLITWFGTRLARSLAELPRYLQIR